MDTMWWILASWGNIDTLPLPHVLPFIFLYRQNNHLINADYSPLSLPWLLMALYIDRSIAPFSSTSSSLSFENKSIWTGGDFHANLDLCQMWKILIKELSFNFFPFSRSPHPLLRILSLYPLCEMMIEGDLKGAKNFSSYLAKNTILE